MYSTQYIRVSLILQHRSLEFLRVTRKNCNYAKNFAIKSSTRTRRPRKIFKDTRVINAYLFIYIRFLPFFFRSSVSFKKNSYSQRDENFDGGRRLQKTIPSDLKVRAQTVRTVFRREHFKF